MDYVERIAIGLLLVLYLIWRGIVNLVGLLLHYTLCSRGSFCCQFLSESFEQCSSKLGATLALTLALISFSWQKDPVYDIGLSEVFITVDTLPPERKRLQDSIHSELYGGLVPSKEPGRPFPSTFTVPAWFDYVDNYSDDDDDGESAEPTKDEDKRSSVQPSTDHAKHGASSCGATCVTEEVVKPYNGRPKDWLAHDRTSALISRCGTDCICENDRLMFLEAQVTTLAREKEEELIRRQQAEIKVTELEDRNKKEIRRGEADKARVIRLESDLRRLGKRLSFAAKQQPAREATPQQPSEEVAQQQQSREAMQRNYRDLEKELEEAKQKYASAEQVNKNTQKRCENLMSSAKLLEISNNGLEKELQAAQSKTITLEEQAGQAGRELHSALEETAGFRKQVASYEAQLRDSISSEQVKVAKAKYARLEADLDATKARLAQVDSGEAQIVSTQDIEAGRNRLEDQAKEVHRLNEEKEKAEESRRNQAKEIRKLNEEKEKAEISRKVTFDRHLTLQNELAREHAWYQGEVKKMKADIEDENARLRAAKENIARLEHALQIAGLPQNTVLPDPQMCGNAACRMWKSRTENTFRDRMMRMNRQFEDAKEDRDSCRKQLERLEAEKQRLQEEADRNRGSFLEYERRLAQQDVQSGQRTVRDGGEGGSGPRRKRSDNDQGRDRPAQKARVGES